MEDRERNLELEPTIRYLNTRANTMYLLCAIDHFMYLYGCRNGKVKNLTIYKVNFPFFFVSILINWACERNTNLVSRHVERCASMRDFVNCASHVKSVIRGDDFKKRV